MLAQCARTWIWPIWTRMPRHLTHSASALRFGNEETCLGRACAQVCARLCVIITLSIALQVLVSECRPEAYSLCMR